MCVCVFTCLYVYLFILHAVADEWSDLTVIFKVYQDRLRQKASLLISVPSSSSRLRNPSVVGGEELCPVYCVFCLQCRFEVHLRLCVAVIPAYSDRLRLSLCLVRPRALTSGGGAQKGGGTDRSA